MYDANNSCTAYSFINFCDNIFHIRLDYVWSKYNKSSSSHIEYNQFYTGKLFMIHGRNGHKKDDVHTN